MEGEMVIAWFFRMDKIIKNYSKKNYEKT